MTKPTPTSDPITPAITGLFGKCVEQLAPELPVILDNAREFLSTVDNTLRLAHLDAIYHAVAFDALTLGRGAPDTHDKAIASLLYAVADWMRSDADIVMWLASEFSRGDEKRASALLVTPLAQRACLIKRLAGDDAALLASSRKFLHNEFLVIDRLAAYTNEETRHAA